MRNEEDNIITSLGAEPKLSRQLGLVQLTAYGLNYMIPLAPAIIFGLILKQSGGSVALPYLIALVGMIFTAYAYAYFVKRTPLAGSVYTFVSYAYNNKAIGFITGFSILLDYLLVPTVTALSASYYIHQVITIFSFKIIFTSFVLICGLLNLFGIKVVGKISLIFLCISEAILFIGFIIWAHYVSSAHGISYLISIEPFRFQNLTALFSAASLSLLSYLGFDAITTLAEEAKHPRVDIPRAIFLSLIIGSITIILTGYFGMLVIPNWRDLISQPGWAETTLFHINQISGGRFFNDMYVLFFVVSMGVFNMVATTGASRLLFGIARDGLFLSKNLSKTLNKTNTPVFGIITVIIIQLIVGFLFDIESISELVNFGAIFSFILLNSGLLYVGFKNKQKTVTICGVIGVLINLFVLLNMHKITLLLGGLWVLLGIAYVWFVYFSKKQNSRNL